MQVSVPAIQNKPTLGRNILKQQRDFKSTERTQKISSETKPNIPPDRTLSDLQISPVSQPYPITSTSMLTVYADDNLGIVGKLEQDHLPTTVSIQDIFDIRYLLAFFS